MRTFLLAVTLLGSTAALAKDECHITVGKRDVVKRTGDVIIEGGQVVEDAIALDGTVVVKAGAKVKSAVSLKGSVVVEDGAVVTDTVLSIGGTVTVGKTAFVKSVLELDAEHGIRLRGKDGEDFSFNLRIDGKTLGERIVEESTAKVKDCLVTKEKEG